MGVITPILLILLGVLGASQWLIQKFPDARSFIEGLQPYQVWIGVVGVAWGVWAALRCIFSLGLLLKVPLLLFIAIATAAVLILLGLLLGLEKFREWTGKEEAVREQLEKVASQANTHQRNLGIAALVLAALNLLSMLGF